MFPQRFLTYSLAQKYPTPHIHWEIEIFMPYPPPQNKKREKIIIDDEVTFHHPPSPDAFTTVSLKDTAQYPVLTVSNFPYSLRNRNFRASSATTKKQ